MRLFSLLCTGIALSTAFLQAEKEHSHSFCIPQRCHGSDQNNLAPILRLGLVPRFFEDTAAFSFLGEIGRYQNRINAAVGFPLGPGAHFKLGGEFLNQELSYSFPYGHSKAWTKQYAAGAAYHLDLNFWGLKSLEITGRWSTAPNHHMHKYERHRNRHLSLQSVPQPTFHRSIAGSNAYAFSAGLSIAPWYWSYLSGAVVYDHVEYKRKYLHNKVVSGFGGAVTFEQRLSPAVSAGFIGEFLPSYDYYEGNLRWRTALASTDIIIGIYGGHTQGHRSLPSSTIAGIEIGFDFGLSNYSFTRSVGICDNSPDRYCQTSLGGLDRHYLQWLAAPAVYMPEVLAISQQRRGIHYPGKK